MKNITPDELRKIRFDKASTKIIDVRTPAEVAEGTIEGAENINLMDPEFADKINYKDKELPYIMICRSGNRSGTACGFMETQGFTEVYNLAGGMLGWDGQTV